MRLVDRAKRPGSEQDILAHRLRRARATAAAPAARAASAASLLGSGSSTGGGSFLDTFFGNTRRSASVTSHARRREAPDVGPHLLRYIGFVLGRPCLAATTEGVRLARRLTLVRAASQSGVNGAGGRWSSRPRVSWEVHESMSMVARASPRAAFRPSRGRARHARAYGPAGESNANSPALVRRRRPATSAPGRRSRSRCARRAVHLGDRAAHHRVLRRVVRPTRQVGHLQRMREDGHVPPLRQVQRRTGMVEVPCVRIIASGRVPDP